MLLCDFTAWHEIIDQNRCNITFTSCSHDNISVCIFNLPFFLNFIISRRVFELIVPGQVAFLQEERNSLLAENDVLTDRANQLDTFHDPSTPSGRKHNQLQQQLEAVQEENFR